MALLIPPALELLAVIVLGLIGGVSNPIVRRGTIQLDEKRAAVAASGYVGWAAEVRAVLATPLFLVPQILGQINGVLFAVLLAVGSTPLGVTIPLLNATGLASNAVTDLIIGEGYDLRFLVPGIIAIAGGLVLCSS